FSRVGKYWKKIEKSINEETTVLTMLDVAHSNCWIRSASRHLQSILSTLSTLIEEIRVSCPRLALTPSHSILQMMSTCDVQGILSLLLNNCFPLLSTLEETERESIEATTKEGESIEMSGMTSILKDLSLIDFVQLLEKAMNDAILIELTIDRRDFQPGRTASSLNEAIVSTSSPIAVVKTDYGVIASLRGSQKRTGI
ncbi:hypothetical protein PFISCL1PPCAC_10400, partial [Pristionchus fissidentatus]